MTMRRAFVVYDRYMDHDMTDVSIGGVQTYITALSELMADMGMDVRIVQAAATEKTVALPHATVHGLAVAAQKRQHRIKAFMQFAQDNRTADTDLLVWASFYDVLPSDKLVSLGIQHGIAFDYLGSDGMLRRLAKRHNLTFILKWWQRRVALRAFDLAQYRICVDYNFLNWYRTFNHVEDNSTIRVIPNFADIDTVQPRTVEKFRKVIFARRFVEPRGAVLAIEAARHLLQKYADITFTFAGDGGLKSRLDSLERSYPGRVEVTRYKSGDSLDIHRQHDIAIVPTLGSEGTSLSLLEAMAAGCAVVCTNVGGMTNIIIDRFNGLMINPDTTDLIQAIESLYLDPVLGNGLVVNAQKTVIEGFSKRLWRHKWAEFLAKITGANSHV
jgi:glycosyltransferase involved in cell wall biosynthesis